MNMLGAPKYTVNKPVQWRGDGGHVRRGRGVGSAMQGQARAARHTGAELERRGAWVKAVGEGAAVEPKIFSIFRSF
jgi:hypothetical protein